MPPEAVPPEAVPPEAVPPEVVPPEVVTPHGEGVHPHWLGIPPPPQVAGFWHAVEPQTTCAPQLSFVWPHCTLLQLVVFDSTAQVHSEGMVVVVVPPSKPAIPTPIWPLQLKLGATQATQLFESPHPWLASVGTQELLHNFVPEGHVPKLHWPAWVQMLCAPAIVGHGAHVVSRQP